MTKLYIFSKLFEVIIKLFARMACIGFNPLNLIFGHERTLVQVLITMTPSITLFLLLAWLVLYYFPPLMYQEVGIFTTTFEGVHPW